MRGFNSVAKTFQTSIRAIHNFTSVCFKTCNQQSVTERRVQEIHSTTLIRASSSLYSVRDNNHWSAHNTVCLHFNLRYFEDVLSTLSLAIVTCNVLPKGHLSCFYLTKIFASLKQLTQASGIVVILSRTKAVPAFADGLQGSILPRAIVRATQAFLLGKSWFGCGCGYWWRRGRCSCGSDYGGCESNPLNLKEKEDLSSCT